MVDTPDLVAPDQLPTSDNRLRVTPVGSDTPTPTFDPNEPVVPIQSQAMGPKFDDSEPVIPLGSDEPADHGLSQRQKLSPLGKALSPVTSYGANLHHFENEGLNQASEGVHQMFNPDTSQGPLQSHTIQDIAAGAGKAALGTAGYVAAPISAAYRSFIGQPVEDVTGIPREYTEFAAQLATPYIGLTGPKALPKPVGPVKPSLPVNRFGVTESAGQASQDLPTIRAEQGALRGQAGEPAEKHATEFFEQQQPAQLTEANKNVSKSFDVPGATTIDSVTGLPQGQEIATKPTEAADIVQKSLQKENLRQKADVKALYDKAKALPGEIDADVFRDMPVTIRDGLSNRPEPVYVDENTPNAAKMLRYLNDRIGELKIRNDAALSSPIPSAISGVTLEGVEQWRKAMSSIRADALKAYGTNASDARAAQAVMNEFDRLIGESVNSGAFRGDPRAVAAFNDARAAHSARMKLWGNDAIGRRLQSIIGDPRFEKDPATLNDVARWMYGESGSSNSLNVGTVKRIRKILGDQSPEWSAIKQGLFRQLVDKAGVTRGEKAISNRLREFLTGKGSDLANEVYSPAERDMLNAYADMYDRLDVPLTGANWPNTAAGVIPHIKKMGARITGAVGALIGHAIWPGVGGEVGGYVAGEQVGKALTKAEEARNYKKVANMLPIITQRFKVWQQAVQAQQRLHTAQTQIRLTAAATNLTNALTRLHGAHPEFAKMLTQGPSGPGVSNANEQNQPRARGGKVAAEKALPADHQLGMRVPKGGSSCHTCFFLKAPTKCGNKGFVAWNHNNDEIPGPPDEYCCDNYKHTFKRAKGGKVKLPPVDDASLAPDDNVDSLADQMIDAAKHFADGGVPTADDDSTTPQTTDASQPLAPGQRLYVAPGNEGGKGTQTTQDQPAQPTESPADTSDQSPGILSSINDAAKRFTNYDRQFTEDVLNLPKYAYQHTQEMRDAVKNVLGINELQNKYREGMGIPQEETPERYQTWPERMVRSGATLAHDVYTGDEPFYVTDPVSGEQVISPRIIERGMDMAGMAGTGGLANAEEGAVLNATPSLRPALKYQGKIYKAPPGGEHADAMPPQLYAEYQKQALSGEDMSNFDFGFMNHKGQFLNREDALKYGIDNGILDPHSARYGALTTPVLRSETDKPGAAVAGLSKSAEPFYSAAEQTVAASRNQKMQGVQWANWLKNQPGVKPDELQYTGVDNWLRSQQGPVTKQQVQDYLAQNKVQLNDVTKGAKTEKDFKRINDYVDGRIEDYVYDERMRGRNPRPNEIEDYRDRLTEHVVEDPTEYGLPDIGSTKYHGYQLPGGENYREHLITLPLDKAARNQYALQATKIPYDQLHPEMQRIVNDDFSKRATGNYRSSHWDEPNILAHVRTNERDVGGVPSLHLEELQSDWHQAGRKKGYRAESADDVRKQLEQAREDLKQIEHAYNNTSPNLPDKKQARLEEYKKAELKIENLQDRLQQAKNGVPDAPFKTSWPELAMKRMIRQAAEEGKDRISWTPGEAQAARYDLSKTYKTINAVKKKDGSYMIQGQPAGYEASPMQRLADNVSGDKLADYVGKDLAEKITEQGGGKFEGVDLKVGGSGMKGFYDQMLPKMVEKLGKQYGVKVKKGDVLGQVSKEDNWMSGERAMELTGIPESEWRANAHSQEWRDKLFEKARAKLAEEKGARQPVWYFDIPEKMKQDVLTKGFPLFSDTAKVAGINANNTERPKKKEPAARAHGGRVVASLINHNPTKPQQDAGNYKKEHIHILGLPITIENARGSHRSGAGKDGKIWKAKLHAHYGYIIGHQKGHDGDHVDVYVGPHIKSKKVYIINQIDADTKKFDEHKCCLGFATIDQAIEVYHKGFSDGRGKDRIGSIAESTIDDFRDWLRDGDMHKPYRIPFTYGKIKHKGVTVDQQV